jgi:hypothetical protein
MKKILAVIVIALFALSIPTLAAPVKAVTDGSDWTLTVLSPIPYQVVTTSVLPLHVFANNYQFDSRFAGTPNLPTIGHYHEILDGRLIDMSPTTDPQHDTISMVGVVPSLTVPHVLTIVPARNDHSMIMQNAVNIPFIYAGPFLPQPGPFTFNGPATVIIVPPTSNVVKGNSFVLTVNVQNFVLSGESFGKELVAGVGHWHIFLAPPGTLSMPEMATMLTMASTNHEQVYLTGITPGWHTFSAVLVDNQHMPFVVTDPATMAMSLAPGTVASITLNVNPAD